MSLTLYPENLKKFLKKLENAETDLNDMAAAIEESEKDRQAVEIEIAKNKDAVERITASFTFKSIEEAEAAESDAKFKRSSIGAF